jgi:hypothetical protein
MQSLIDANGVLTVAISTLTLCNQEKVFCGRVEEDLVHLPRALEGGGFEHAPNGHGKSAFAMNEDHPLFQVIPPDAVNAPPNLPGTTFNSKRVFRCWTLPVGTQIPPTIDVVRIPRLCNPNHALILNKQRCRVTLHPITTLNPGLADFYTLNDVEALPWTDLCLVTAADVKFPEWLFESETGRYLVHCFCIIFREGDQDITASAVALAKLLETRDSLDSVFLQEVNQLIGSFMWSDEYIHYKHNEFKLLRSLIQPLDDLN